MRVRKLIEGLVLDPEHNLAQIYVFKSLKRIMIPGKFLLNDFLSPAEFSRLSLTNYGKIMYIK